MAYHTGHVLLFFNKNDLLLDDDGQVHTWMDSAVQLEGSCCIKWADGCAVVAVEGFVDRGSAVFGGRFWGCAIPGAVRNDMCGSGIVHEVEHITFVDRNRSLYEGGSAHMHRWKVCGSAGVDYGASAQ
jgi:hypothetical protein